MNIVRGVADLIRRASSIQTGESTSGTPAERCSPPSPKICFREVGDEAVLHSLWEKYKNATNKVEKKKLFHIFLKQFVAVYKNWEPVNASQLLDGASTTVPPVEYPLHSNDVVIGCSRGHPAEVIMTFCEELTQLTILVTNLNTSVVHPGHDLPGASTFLNVTSEGLPVLDALSIITRSIHNCRVFGYYGGIQKLTALMKGAVVQLKAVSSALSGDENLSNMAVERTRVLQQVLVYVVSTTCNFIDLNTNIHNEAHLYSSSIELSFASWGPSSTETSSTFKIPTETRLHWHRKAVVSVMEAGGLNWLVGKSSCAS